MTRLARAALLGCLTSLSLAAAAAPAVSAEAILGTWLSPPDPKNQTGHMVVRPCGNAYCGVLEKAFAPSGQQIRTENVGKRLLWDMVPQGGNVYEGKVFVPLFNRTYDATVKVSGGGLAVRGCWAGICKTQQWRRVN